VEIDNGRGTVTANPGGSFTCTTTGGKASRTYTFSSGTSVTLSASSLRYIECQEVGCQLVGSSFHQWYARSPASGWVESGNTGAVILTTTMDADKSIKVQMNGQCFCGNAPGPGPVIPPVVPPVGPPTGPCPAAMACADTIPVNSAVSAKHVKDIHDDYVLFVSNVSATNRLSPNVPWNQLGRGKKISAEYLRDLQQAIRRTNADLGNLITTLTSSADIQEYAVNKRSQVKRSHINHLCTDLKLIRAIYNGIYSCP
jgi:hypothetical protein